MSRRHLVREHRRLVYRSMDRNGQQFGKQPSWPAFDGIVAELRRAELAVYVVLVAHSRDGQAKVGVRRIAELAGMTQRSAIRAVHTLMSKKLIRIDQGGGRSRCNTYTISQNPDAGVTVSAGQRVTPARRKGDTGRQERVTHGAHIEQSREQKRNSEHPLFEAGAERWPSAVETDWNFWLDLARSVEDARSGLTLRVVRRMIRSADSFDAFKAQITDKEVRRAGA